MSIALYLYTLTWPSYFVAQLLTFFTVLGLSVSLMHLADLQFKYQEADQETFQQIEQDMDDISSIAPSPINQAGNEFTIDPEDEERCMFDNAYKNTERATLFSIYKKRGSSSTVGSLEASLFRSMVNRSHKVNLTSEEQKLVRLVH